MQSRNDRCARKVDHPRVLASEPFDRGRFAQGQDHALAYRQGTSPPAGRVDFAMGQDQIRLAVLIRCTPSGLCGNDAGNQHRDHAPARMSLHGHAQPQCR